MATTIPPTVSPPLATPPLAASTFDDTVVPTADRQFVSSPLGWSAILAATAITLGVWLALHLFGIGVGLTAIDPNDTSSLRGAGIGVGIWSLAAPIIALFIGGLVAGRVAPTINTLNAVIHGAVVWALSLLVTMLMLSMMFSALARGATAAGQAVVGTAGEVVGAAGGGAEAMQALGVDAEDLFGPVNEQLEQRGMPRISPDEAKAATQEVVKTAVREGKLDRARAVDILAARTKLSREDAEQIATELERQVGELQQRGGEVVAQAQTTALGAAESMGKVLMALVALMVLGLAAAVAGSILSVRRERRTHVHLPRATMTRTAVVES